MVGEGVYLILDYFKYDLAGEKKYFLWGGRETQFWYFLNILLMYFHDNLILCIYCPISIRSVSNTYGLH